jgi:hypothetical protein
MPVFAIIILTGVDNWGPVFVVITIVFGILILAMLVAVGVFIATLFSVLLPSMADGASRLALMIGLPAIAIAGAISVLAKVFKIGRPGW